MSRRKIHSDGLQKNTAAGTPEYKSSKSIAFICGRIGSSFVSSVVRGAESRIADMDAAQYKLEHYPSAGRKDGPGDAVREIIAGKKAEGIILLSVMPDENALKQLVKSGIPAVSVERKFNGLHSVMVDNFSGGASAALHLIKSGRKRPAFILDPQCGEKGSASGERLRGFRAVIKKAGIKPCDSANSAVKYHTIDEGRKAFETAAKKIDKADCIFSAAGDLAAIGFMLEARSCGVMVPEDLAVIGFDDVEMASAVEPALTTVRQPIAGMGENAADIMHGCLSGREHGLRHMLLRAELIKRSSA